jgi:hypothetical protein
VRCRERSGFLFAHSCDRGATQKCSRCGKDICKDHLRPGTICVSCEKQTGGAGGVRRARGGRDEAYHDDPYWYSYGYYDDYHYYDDRDQQVFDPTEQTAVEAGGFEGDFDGS